MSNLMREVQPLHKLISELRAEIYRLTGPFSTHYAGTVSLQLAPHNSDALVWIYGGAASPSDVLIVPPRYTATFEWAAPVTGNTYPAKANVRIDESPAPIKHRFFNWSTKPNPYVVEPVFLPLQRFLILELLDHEMAMRLATGENAVPWRLLDIRFTISGNDAEINGLVLKKGAEIIMRFFNQASKKLTCQIGILGDIEV